MFYTVYKVTNQVNGKFYIGVHKTLNPNDDYLGSGQLINRAVKKYGKDSFIKEILHMLESEKEAYDKEKEIVNQELVDSGVCYNVKIGGLGGLRVGVVRSPETRQKMSISKMGKPRSEETKQKLRNKIVSEETKAKLRGRIISPEHREKIKLKLTGGKMSIEAIEKMKARVTSDETKAKLRAARTGQIRAPHSEATKEKMRMAKKGKVYSEEAKAVIRQKKLATKLAKLSKLTNSLKSG